MGFVLWAFAWYYTLWQDGFSSSEGDTKSEHLLVVTGL